MRAADLARLCRDDYQGVGAPAWANGGSEYVAVRNDDLNVYYQAGRRLVVICRGTEIPRGALPFAREWILNLIYRPRPWSGFAAVHQGLAHNVEDLYRKLRWSRTFDRWRDEGGSLIVTGHSRGGALALLLATLFARNKTPPERVVTFGAPRVGGAQWRDKYHGLGIPTLRYENHLDPVPALPPFVFFRHVGQRVIANPSWTAAHDIDDYVAGLRS